ncbi:hypothetical protein [Saccharothrix sp. ST-888]|uniref:hypothetical protein n=1 Tax=Saccharothrix sp. ST-888 TaxID=1427391 RepID=UPI000698265B|nr:hypothetical protein [Saccharothrix sp. ST-888]
MSSTAATALPQTDAEQLGTAADPAAAEPLPEAEPLPTVAEMQLPAWFFGFEGVLAGAFDILHAFPGAWPALVVLFAVNITVSLTMMRKRLKLAKMLWRGKGTRKVAFLLLGLRIGSHVLLSVIGVALTSALVHVLFAAVMAALTVGLLVYTQKTALRALVEAGKLAA